MAKVMIVDDSVPLAKIARMTLEKAGFEVTVAGNGQEALDQIPTENPNIILLDAEMPVLDGWETCEALKSNEATKGIPVVMCTGDDDPEYLEKSEQLGANGYLVKPVPPPTLIQKVKEILGES